MRAIGIDIGSTSLKGCLFDLTEPNEPQTLEEFSFDIPLLRPKPGHAEHNLQAMSDALGQLFARLPPNIAVGFSSAMHALVLCDDQGMALGNALSWADTRSEAQARKLHSLEPGAHSRTGTPIHAMAWPAKLLWARDEMPQRWSAVGQVLDLKTHLLRRYTGLEPAMDLSNASATGLFNQVTQQWDESLCRQLHLDAIRLPQVLPVNSKFEHQGRVFTLGGGDGPLGNLGVGAITPTRLAISLGTSGAVRRAIVSAPHDCPGELFQYALLEGMSIQGGAISNGGSVLDWLRRIRDLSPSAMMNCAEPIPVGSEGLIVHPYFSGERAPFWRSDVRSAIRGWSFRHDFGHLVRACLEGIAFCIFRLIRILGVPEEPLHCTGGLFQNDFWCQLLADVTGCPIARSPVAEATALGAALLTLDDPLAVSQQLPIGQLYEPRAKIHHTYQTLYADWAQSDPYRPTESSASKPK